MFSGDRVPNEAGKGNLWVVGGALLAGAVLAQSGIVQGLTDGPAGKLTVNAKLTDAQVERKLGCDMPNDTDPVTLGQPGFNVTPAQKRCLQKAAHIAANNSFGWNTSQQQALDELWTRESNWSPRAKNPTSSAYGIPQALEGSTMRGLPKRGDYRRGRTSYENSAYGQICWGLTYIKKRYGTPSAALAWHNTHHWY